MVAVAGGPCLSRDSLGAAPQSSPSQLDWDVLDWLLNEEEAGAERAGALLLGEDDVDRVAASAAAEDDATEREGKSS